MKTSKDGRAFSGDLESYAKARQQVVRLERGEGAALNEIDKLEARKTQLLNNPSAGDHVKAFFKHGTNGINGEVEKIDKQLETLRAAVDEAQHGVSVQDDREQVQLLKESERELKAQIESLRHDAGGLALNRQFKVGVQATDEEFVGMQQKLDEMVQAREAIQSKIKKEEGVISVREKLGIKANPQTPLRVDAPQQDVEDVGVDLPDLELDKPELGPKERFDQEVPKESLQRTQSVRDLVKTGAKTTTEGPKRKMTK
jgi:predicted  nucleic acid-binding Zn-ribbon protein